MHEGAKGIVLEGMGSGNGPPTVTATVTELTATGVVIALSSRVHAGPVAPLYGGPGSGRELVAAGAIPTGWMRPSHARIALLALLASDPRGSHVRRLFNAWASAPYGHTSVPGHPPTAH